MPELIDTCNTIIHYNKKDDVDVYAERQLKSTFAQYKQAKKIPLANLRYVVNGVKTLSLLEAMVDNVELRKLKILFLKPRMNENWDYNTPTKKLELYGMGLGKVETFHYKPFSLDKWDFRQSMNKEKIMIRGYFAQYYYPRSIKNKTAEKVEGEIKVFTPTLMTLEKLWQVVRIEGIVPFQIHVCAYTQHNRYGYDLDLVNNMLIKDFRGGTVPLKDKAQRNSMDYFNFDRVLASTDMKELVKRTFITLFEMNEATAFDIAHGFGITDTMAKNTLDALVTRGLADKEGKPPRETYSIDPEKLKDGEHPPELF